MSNVILENLSFILVMGAIIFLEIIEYKYKVITNFKSYIFINILTYLSTFLPSNYFYIFPIMVTITYFMLTSFNVYPPKALHYNLSFVNRISRKVIRAFVIICSLLFLISILFTILYLLHIWFKNHYLEVKDFIKNHENLDLFILIITLINNMLLFSKSQCHDIMSNRFISDVLTFLNNIDNKQFLNNIRIKLKNNKNVRIVNFIIKECEILRQGTSYISRRDEILLNTIISYCVYTKNFHVNYKCNKLYRFLLLSKSDFEMVIVFSVIFQFWNYGDIIILIGICYISWFITHLLVMIINFGVYQYCDLGDTWIDNLKIAINRSPTNSYSRLFK